MKKIVMFWCALAIALYFYAKMDILIWQRIFETHQLLAVGIGTYHWGWIHALFGFMFLGGLIFYPHLRRMISFPLSLTILAFSGLEDILYYWLDGRSIPPMLPWLNLNPLILKPVTAKHLVLSAVFWILFVLVLDLAGEYLDRTITFSWKRVRVKIFNFVVACSLKVLKWITYSLRWLTYPMRWILHRNS